MKTLHISAGGKGSRIADYIGNLNQGIPCKHLLPLPSNTSLLGEIIRTGEHYFQQLTIWSSEYNHKPLELFSAEYSRTTVQQDLHMSGPLGPVIRNLLTKKTRSYGCAGDYWSDFSWKAFEAFHESHDFPVSILVAHSCPSKISARFNTTGKLVSSWERIEETSERDLINIGCYIIDPDPTVVKLITSLTNHKEDEFFDTFIPKNLVAGFEPSSHAFNVNTPDVYHQLISYLT